MPEGGAVLEEAEPDALAYIDFPPSHWKRLRTNQFRGHAIFDFLFRNR